MTGKIKLMARPFTGHKIFWAVPNVLGQTKNVYAFCATPKDDFHSVN